jgi:acyl carrier protein
MSGPQFRADRPAEQEAVRTTIVGGRPPGSGQKVGPIPRGIEVLLRKASVDPAFKELLLRQRGGAAETIGLTLEPGEAMMLTAAPVAQLEAVIARTSVPQEHRRAFLGQAAAAMLAALGAAIAKPVHAADGAIAKAAVMRPAAIVVGTPIPVPPKNEKVVEEQVIAIISERTGVEAKRIKRDDTLVKDLGAKADALVEIRKDIAKKFDIKIPEDEAEKVTVVAGVPIPSADSDDDFKKVGTVGQAIDYVDKALKKKAQANGTATPVPIRPIMAGVMRGPNN